MIDMSTKRNENNSENQEKTGKSQSTDIVKTEQFHEIPVRLVKKGKNALFPLVDIADAIDYPRGTLTNLLKSNEEDFTDYKGVAVTATPSRALNNRNGGPQELVCLTRDGVIMLLMALDIKRIQDPEKRARIREFRKWVIETIGKVMDGEIPAVPQARWIDTAEQHMKFANGLVTA